MAGSALSPRERTVAGQSEDAQYSADHRVAHDARTRLVVSGRRSSDGVSGSGCRFNVKADVTW
jgi:hypothetical protein